MPEINNSENSQQNKKEPKKKWKKILKVTLISISSILVLSILVLGYTVWNFWFCSRDECLAKRDFYHYYKFFRAEDMDGARPWAEKLVAMGAPAIPPLLDLYPWTDISYLFDTPEGDLPLVWNFSPKGQIVNFIEAMGEDAVPYVLRALDDEWVSKEAKVDLVRHVLPEFLKAELPAETEENKKQLENITSLRKECLAEMLRLAEDKNNQEEFRKELMRAMSAGKEMYRNDEAFKGALLKMVRDESESNVLRGAALERLAELKDDLAVEILVECLDNVDNDILQTEAVEIINRIEGIQDERLVEPLVKYLESEQKVTYKERAIRALGSTHNQSAIEPLIKILNGQYFSLRVPAALALKWITEKEYDYKYLSKEDLDYKQQCEYHKNDSVCE